MAEGPEQEDGDGDAVEARWLPDPAGPQMTPAFLLELHSRRDLIGCLGLPQPTVNEAGRPVWPVTARDIARAYRQVARHVHPDKVKAGDVSDKAVCGSAFAALNDAFQTLRDEAKQADILRVIAERLVRDAERASLWTSGDAVAACEDAAARQRRARELRREEADDFATAIGRQAKERASYGPAGAPGVEARAYQERRRQRAAGQGGDEEDLPGDHRREVAHDFSVPGPAVAAARSLPPRSVPTAGRKGARISRPREDSGDDDEPPSRPAPQPKRGGFGFGRANV